MPATKQWSITVDIDEQEDTTLAHVSLRTPAGHDVTGVGQAQRNPMDPSVPEIGDELAVARALRNLAERLLHTTEKDISGRHWRAGAPAPVGPSGSERTELPTRSSATDAARSCHATAARAHRAADAVECHGCRALASRDPMRAPRAARDRTAGDPRLTDRRRRDEAGRMADSTPENWRRVDDYLAATLLDDDPALTEARSDSDAAGLPAIEVTPLAGKLLHLLARMTGARHVLEVGTLGGYSTIWLARGIPRDGRVVTLELEQRHADVARANLERAGVSEQVEIVVGRAADTLPRIAERGDEPFDLVFIDADKESNTIYIDWAIRLGHPGTVIVVDNVGREGEVADPGTDDSMVIGTQRGLELLGSDPRVDATALQTVGAKGWDGIAIAIVV